MKTLISIYAGDAAGYVFEPVFEHKSAFDRVISWMQVLSSDTSCGTISGAVVFVSSEYEMSVRSAIGTLPFEITVITGDFTKASVFIAELARYATGFDAVIHARCGCPFYDAVLTAQLFALHIRSASEYTFADGWPEGFAPCVIDTGTVSILASIAGKTAVNRVTRDVFFELMKGDINSFEIETLIAPEDMRQYRFDFNCNTKRGLIACLRLFEIARNNSNPDRFTADVLASKAVFSSAILRTVPTFYNVQISSECPGTCTYCPYPVSYKMKFGHEPSQSAELNSCCFMDAGRFADLVHRMAQFSGEAVVSLSLWGEPLAHPEFIRFVEAVLVHQGLSLLIETDGMLLTDTLVEKTASLTAQLAPRTNGHPAISWIVSVDAVDESMYTAMRGAGTQKIPVSYKKAQEAVSVLERYFPGNVYAQFVRTTVNESQLETFYRSRKEAGNLIIQKYDSFAGMLPDVKVADLSPLVRNPCWHQRRDMVILADGSVPFCREYMFDGICGNVFTDSLETVWRQGKDMVYTEKCKACDEYYTFNF